jgi:amidase
MIPARDAEVVRRLPEARAVLLGKTNLPDVAGHGTRTRSSVSGVTLNPYAEDRVPGGSSGATATAVGTSARTRRSCRGPMPSSGPPGGGGRPR